MPKKSEEKEINSIKKREKLSDLKDVEAKLEKLKAHYEKNKQDKKAMRDRERIFSKLRQLKKYHKIEN